VTIRVVLASLVALPGLLGACSTGRPERPESFETEVRLNFPGDADLGALRAAAIWVSVDGEDDDWIATADVELEDPRRFELELTVPKSVRRDRLTPQERLTFVSTPRVSALVYRPHLVVYRDVDENQRLNADLFDRTGPDQILALDYQTGVAAVLDVEALLRRLPDERAESFYRATGGRFTEFVKTGVLGGLQILDPRQPVALEMREPELSRQLIECARAALSSSSTISTLTVSDALDLNTFCDITRSGCRSEDLDQLDPVPKWQPDPYLGSGWWPICHERAGVQSLVVAKSTDVCDECRCRSEFRIETYVASLDALPDWWPCGDEVELCRDASSLTLPGACPDLADAGVDAGLGTAAPDAGSDASVEDF